MSRHVVVVGSGIFGATGALELARRGDRVTLVDAGEIPNPLAESTDVSKAVRTDYGSDELYTSEMERALETWRAWNDAWGETLFHETGAMFVTREAMAPGGFEHDSFATLTRRGHLLHRLDARAIEAQSSLRGFVDGYFNPSGGWVESSRVVECVIEKARERGVVVREHARASRVRISGGRATGIVFEGGDVLDADAIVLTTGGWIGALVPEIARCFRTVGQAVFHVACDGDLRLPVFGADIARTGWYGFPAHRDGFVKIANHGVGRAMHPDSSERSVVDDERAKLREFLRETLPTLADAAITNAHVCVYCDSADEHFWITPHPDVANLVVATGGSGHGFKFAPRVGEWIARALEGDVIPRFRWRADTTAARGEEPARAR